MAFVSVVLPIFLVIASGYALQRRRPMDTRILSALLMYLFVPALTFDAILNNPLTGSDIGVMVAFGVALTIVSWILAALGGRWLKLDKQAAAGVLAGSLLMNTGNYGASAALFAWGDDGFQMAIVFMAVHYIFAGPIAIYACARGTLGARESLRALIRQPLLYATLIAAAIRLAGWEASDLPSFVVRPIELIGQANVPVALVLLGMHLVGMRLKAEDYSALGLLGLSRLVLPPLLLLPLLPLIGAEGTLRDVLLMQSAMPVAVSAVAFASEFDARPDLVGAGVITTTLASLVTTSILLQLLGVG